MNFWGNFVAECDAIGKKPNPVAQELGISSGTVTAWKRGSVPSSKNLLRIAEYFGVTEGYLMRDADDPSNQAAAAAFVDRIKLLADEQEISLVDLSLELGFSRATIYSWRTKSPSLDNAQKVADRFEVSIDWLMGRTKYRDIQLSQYSDFADEEMRQQYVDWVERHLDEIRKQKKEGE